MRDFFRGFGAVFYKEVLHVRRDPATLFFSLVIPLLQMVVLGFACHQGHYTAVNPGKGLVDDNPLQLSPPGSIEWNLHRIGHARCVLDLRKALEAREGKWLDQPLPFRMVGALAMRQQFFPARVTGQYDALIYFDRTNPSVCFRVKKE